MADPPAPEGRYLLDNAEEAAALRLRSLSALFDPWTFDHLDRLGLRAGWRCWEVGAGGPTVPTFMADRVGPSGAVVATDLDVTHLGPPEGRRFETRRHDVGAAEPPGEGFDLVHARLVLTHVPRRAAALDAMAAALRPGGWMLVEDADPDLQPLTCIDEHGPEQVLANRLRRGFRTLLAGAGASTAFGRSLPRLLRGCGLSDVAADAFFPVGGPECAALERATVVQVRARLVGAGLATEEEVGRHLAAVDRGALDLATSPLVSAWGRRPGAVDPIVAPG